MKKSVILLLILFGIFTKPVFSQEEFYEDLYNRAMSAYNQQNYLQAIQLFDQAQKYTKIQKNLDNIYAYKLLCIKKTEEQQIALKTALKKAEDEKRRADSLVTIANYEKEKAEAALKRAEEKQKNNQLV